MRNLVNRASALTAVLLLLALMACGGGSSNSANNNGSNTPGTPTSGSNTGSGGSNSGGPASNPAALIAVANRTAGTVSLIDTSKNQISSTVTVGRNLIGIAMTPNGRFVYVSDLYSQSVYVIDTASSKVVATIANIKDPGPIAITTDGRFAYVTDVMHLDSAVTVIDTNTNQVVTTVKNVAMSPGSITIPAGLPRAYVADAEVAAVSVVDLASNTVVKSIDVPFAYAIASTPSGRFVYVTTQFDNSVKVIDTSTNTVIASVSVPPPQALAVTPDGSQVWVASPSNGSISVISTASNTVVKTFNSLGSQPWDVAFSTDGKFAYVTNSGSANVSVVRVADYVQTSPIPVGTDPEWIASGRSK